MITTELQEHRLPTGLLANTLAPSNLSHALPQELSSKFKSPHDSCFIKVFSWSSKALRVKDQQFCWQPCANQSFLKSLDCHALHPTLWSLGFSHIDLSVYWLDQGFLHVSLIILLKYAQKVSSMRRRTLSLITVPLCILLININNELREHRRHFQW